MSPRDKFREAVFKRDGYKCVACESAAVDAHHIIERRLFPDGGYFLSNGASLCGACHLRAEQTVLSCEEIRRIVGITDVVLPPHLYNDVDYDKWGNTILSNGSRLPGELFDDESVQKVLAPVLHLFREPATVKYPRTYHLPWSPGLSKDDRVMTDLSAFVGQDVVVHVKMDGENTTFHRGGLYARSLDGYSSHPSRVAAKVLWSKVGYELPEGWRLCGENLQGKHSIHYKNLRSFFYGFSLWDERNNCLSWGTTKEYLSLLGVTACPVLYEGKWDEAVLRTLWKPEFEGDECEGYVVRVARSYRFAEFRNVVGKYVRTNHVQTHAHWMQRFESNGLR